jgi:predicted ribosome quality control (RQC) complex YloA/Tae2 family protein
MTYQISGIELYYLINEFQILIDGKVDKIYQISEKEFLFNFHIPKLGKKSLRINIPNYTYFTQKKLKTPENPPGFCMFLRKRLDNARVREITQIGLERIFNIVFETKEKKYILIIELFSKGNIALCDEKLQIIQCLEKQVWKDREIAPKKEYIFPKQKINPLLISIDDFESLLKNTIKDKIVTFIAMDIGLGGKYSEIVCDELKINKEISPKEIKDITELFNGIKKIFEKKIENYSNELDNQINDGEIAVDSPKENKKLEKLKEIIRNQENHIISLNKEIEEFNKAGELIYSNYQFINSILNEFLEAKKKMSVEEIKKKVKNKSILGIDPKDKSIVFELN